MGFISHFTAYTSDRTLHQLNIIPTAKNELVDRILSSLGIILPGKTNLFTNFKVFFLFFQAGVYFHLRQVVVFILKRAKASNNEITTCTYYSLTITVCEHGSPAHQLFKPLVYKAQQSEKGVFKGRHRQPVVKFSLYL